jgi:hypothetical protein
MTWSALTTKKISDPSFCDIDSCEEKAVSAIATRSHLPRDTVRLCECHSKLYHENSAWKSIPLEEVDMYDIMTA